MKKVKAVLFDLDDTLLQTSKARYGLVKKVGKELFNQEITDEMISSHWGKPFHTFVHDLYGVDDFEVFLPKYLQHRDEFPSIPYEDAVEVVTQLVDRMPVGIVSAATRELILGDLLPHGFPTTKLFRIQSSEDTLFHKPDPRVFDRVLEDFANENILKDEVVYIGDGLHDYHAARDAGMQFVGIANRTTAKESFEKENAQTILTLSELLNLLVV